MLISLISAIVCIFDKHRAKQHGWRVRESTLLLLSFLGGGVAMYATMRIIRHKTKHPKFMVGIPVIILFHAGLLIFVFWYLTNK